MGLSTLCPIFLTCPTIWPLQNCSWAYSCIQPTKTEKSCIAQTLFSCWHLSFWNFMLWIFLPGSWRIANGLYQGQCLLAILGDNIAPPKTKAPVDCDNLLPCILLYWQSPARVVTMLVVCSAIAAGYALIMRAMVWAFCRSFHKRELWQGNVKTQAILEWQAYLIKKNPRPLTTSSRNACSFFPRVGRGNCSVELTFSWICSKLSCNVAHWAYHCLRVV